MTDASRTNNGCTRVWCSCSYCVMLQIAVHRLSCKVKRGASWSNCGGQALVHYSYLQAAISFQQLAVQAHCESGICYLLAVWLCPNVSGYEGESDVTVVKSWIGQHNGVLSRLRSLSRRPVRWWWGSRCPLW